MPLSKNKELNRAMKNRWQIDMMEAPCKEPRHFCCGFCCVCCAAYQQRDELLKFTGEPYVCCGGMFPCGPLGQPCDRNLLFVEALCCPYCAISGTIDPAILSCRSTMFFLSYSTSSHIMWWRQDTKPLGDSEQIFAAVAHSHASAGSDTTPITR